MTTILDRMFDYYCDSKYKNHEGSVWSFNAETLNEILESMQYGGGAPIPPASITNKILGHHFKIDPNMTNGEFKLIH